MNAYGSLEALGTVWRGTLLGASIGLIHFGLARPDEDVVENLLTSAGIGAMLSGLWTTGAGMIAASRASRNSDQNQAGIAHATTGFFAGLGAGSALVGASNVLLRRQPKRRRSARPAFARVA